MKKWNKGPYSATIVFIQKGQLKWTKPILCDTSMILIIWLRDFNKKVSSGNVEVILYYL